MADKNGNGIDDSKEKIKAGQKVSSPFFSIGGRTKVERAPEREENPWLAWLNRPIRQGLNFLGDLSGGFQRNKFDSWGTGVGDYALGVTPGYYAEKNREAQDPRYNSRQTLFESAWPTDRTPVGGYKGTMPGGTTPRNPFEDRNWGQQARDDRAEAPGQMSFSDVLAQAIEMLGGGQDAAGINYDPYRQTARDNAARADKALQGIYGALARSIAGDAAGIGTSYDQALQGQDAVTSDTAESIQQGYQSANDMLTQQAAALGIGQAVGNQIQRGETGAGDMAQALNDNAASGAGARTQLNTNRQSALDYNTSVKQAAEMEGASQRAQRTAELASVLAQIDMQEQEANRSAQSSGAGDAIGLAQWLWEQSQGSADDSWQMEKEARELALSEWIAQQKYGDQQVPGSPINAESTKLLMELLGISDPAEFQRWIQDNPTGYTSLIKNTR